MSIETLKRPEISEHDLKALDFEISCNVDGCEHAADWWSVCLSCGAHDPVCDPHQRKQIVWAEHAGAGYFVLCPSCRVAVPSSSWRHLFTFVPIGRP